MLKLFFLIIVAIATSSFANSQEASQSKKQEVARTIKGALVTLINMQIQDREGRYSPEYDSCSDGDGCFNEKATIDKANHILLPSGGLFPKLQNNKGEWSSTIHFFGDKLRNKKTKMTYAVLDSNMFVTASTLYPLAFLNRKNSPLIEQMVSDAYNTIASYKRNGVYVFWAEKNDSTNKYRIVGPRNMIADSFKFLGFKYWPKLLPIMNRTTALTREHWLDYLIDKRINPIGAESGFNVTADNDDTSLAIISEKLFSNDIKQDEISYLVTQMSRYRDLNRRWEYPSDTWKKKNSGAFLTWMKDEALDPLASFDTKTGTIPYGVNNVDCVVNANVLFSLGLSSNKDADGYLEAADLAADVIENKSWPECGTYYPQNMMFPYSISRAYRDGNVKTERLEKVVGKLLLDIIKMQEQLGRKHSHMRGAFPGGFDEYSDLSTAMGLVTLLNIGEQKARSIGIQDRYNLAIEQSVDYLLSSRIREKPYAKKALLEAENHIHENFKWKAGTFFSSSDWSLAHWRSEPFTVAIVLEALSKYQLNWQQSSEPVSENMKKISVDL